MPEWLSQVYDFSLWTVFRVEREEAVRQGLGLEIGDVNGGPLAAFAHFDDTGCVRFAVDGEVYFLQGALLVLRFHAHLIVGSLAGHA